MIKYLVFAIFQEVGGIEIVTHSKEFELIYEGIGPCAMSPDSIEKIVADITESGMDRIHLYELFVWKSAPSPTDTPIMVLHLTRDDGLLGLPEDEEEDDEEEDED